MKIVSKFHVPILYTFQEIIRHLISRLNSFRLFLRERCYDRCSTFELLYKKVLQSSELLYTKVLQSSELLYTKNANALPYIRFCKVLNFCTQTMPMHFRIPGSGLLYTNYEKFPELLYTNYANALPYTKFCKVKHSSSRLL